MTQWRFAVPALVVVSLFATVTASAASRSQSDVTDVRLPDAAQSGNQAEVQALLREHVSVDSAEGDGTTALHWAAYQNNLPLAQELLNAHANVNAVTRLESVTPLYMACQSGSAPMVELLLKYGANVNQANGLGTTPLMMAAASGNAAVVKALLDHGANVNAKEQMHDQTALMFAANLNRADVIRVLLAHGADPNAESKVVATHKPGADRPRARALPAGSKAAAAPKPAIKPVSADAKLTAVSVSTESGNKADAKLVAGSASKKSGNKKEAAAAPAFHLPGATVMGGMTPLLYAARQDNLAAVTALLDGGANINEPSGSEHTTPLVMAIMNGHLDLAKVLVERGADVNVANVYGIAPLWATEDVQYPPTGWNVEPLVAQEKTNYLSLMKLLLAHGENPNIRIKEEPWERVQERDGRWIKDPGATAFFRAAEAWDVAAMKLLKDNGADPNITTDKGTTPLMAAAGLGWAPMFTMTTQPTSLVAVQYLVGIGADVKAQDNLGYTALHGAAFIGQLKTIQYLVDHGANVNAKTKGGDSVADMANGPFEKSQLHPEAVSLLVKLGAVAPHNCRSSSCVPATLAQTAANKAPAAGNKTPAAADKTAIDATLTAGKKPGRK